MHDPVLENQNETEIARISVDEFDKILGKKFPILDKGFIRVIDYMGDDSSIVQAARVSYGAGTKSVNQDEGLIRYLLRHRHTTPFEMCEIKLHIKAPIFIARQWLRHRTANVNEVSARYSILNEEFFVPEVDQICQQSKGNKQGRENAIEKAAAMQIVESYTKNCNQSFEEYNKFMTEHNLAREIARGILPMSSYTEFYWKIDLHNLLHFLFLRAGGGAQKEIRDYANKMLEIVSKWVPITYKAFMDYRKNAIEFYGSELQSLASVFDGEKLKQMIDQNADAKGEKKEFIEKLKQVLKLIENV
jgi:thymidylate synthase (FAD)